MQIMPLALLLIASTTILGAAHATFPFEVSDSSVPVSSYDIDSEVNSAIFQIQVDQRSDVLELVLDRSFLDSVSSEGDEEFLILKDGEKLVYVETNTGEKSRTIKAHLPAGHHEVEIFGSHLFGKTISDGMIPSQIQEQNTQLQSKNELLSEQVNHLSSELVDAKNQNKVLESENTELGKTIFNPDNLISETEEQATHLLSETEEQATHLLSETEEQATHLLSETEEQATNVTLIISQQITAFTDWVGSLFVQN